MVDITDLKRMEEALKESKERYRVLAENAMDGIYVISPQGFEYVNPAFERLFGYKTYEVCNRHFNFLSMIHPEDRKLVLEREEARKKGERLPPRYSFRVVTKGGRIRYVEANTVSLSGEKVRVLGILRDITEQKQTEEALRESEEKHRTLVEQASDGIIIIQDDIFKYANKRVEEMSGYAIEELIGSPPNKFISIKDNPKLSEYYNNRKAGKKSPRVYELPIKHKDGHDLFVEFNTVPITYQGKPANMIIIRDITERKRAEEVIAESKQRYKDLVEKAGVAILIDDFEGNLRYCNKKYAEMFGYTMEEMKGQSIDTLVYPDDVPTVRRYHRGRVRGKDVPSKYECRGIRKDGSTINIEVNAVALRENGGIVGTRCYIWDITDRKRAEEEKQNIYEKLRKGLEETINALSSAVETRDPYTAGHQQRVANLASAIAREMNLSEAQVEGIRMAGVVHDVGKIRVPAEILSKPGAIDEIDFSIIKSHPQIGFNILRKIEFPYLVGQIILQHHERLNGSGYPAGLSGEKILLEAKILAVADVVEAMASHRPYRPALGVDKALKEISRNKGILYDPKVVDACLKLFRQKKFRLS